MQLTGLWLEASDTRVEQRLGIRLQGKQFFQLPAEPGVTVASRVEKSLALGRFIEPACGIKQVFHLGVHLKDS